MSNRTPQEPDNFVFDISCDDDMIIRFMEQYSSFYPQYTDKKHTNEIINFHKLIKHVIIDDKWNELKQNNNFKNYRYGTELHISYTTLSQRYEEEYNKKEFKGYLFYGDDITDNALLFYKHDNVVYVKSIECDSCHYLGMARGYMYFINGY